MNKEKLELSESSGSDDEGESEVLFFVPPSNVAKAKAGVLQGLGKGGDRQQDEGRRQTKPKGDCH